MIIKMNNAILTTIPERTPPNFNDWLLEKMNKPIEWVYDGAHTVGETIANMIGEIFAAIGNSLVELFKLGIPHLPQALGFIALVFMLVTMIMADPKWFSRGLVMAAFMAITEAVI